MPDHMRAIVGAWLCACAIAIPAAAQEQRWEVEAYGGFTAGQGASAGTRTLPPPGSTVVTSSPIFPSREVPSWLFGDGAALLNGVNADFGLAGRIVPLDGAFAPLDKPRTGNFGARVRRRVNPHWAMEVGLDTTTSAFLGAEALEAAAAATRASFESAFTDLLNSGPFSGTIVRTTGGGESGHLRETALTLAFNRRFTSWKLAPYATVGGGLAISSGPQPSASIDAQYRFVVLGVVPIGEDDSVAVRYRSGTAFVIVLGGGLQRDLSDRWGIRIDARVLTGPDPTRVEVDAAPAILRASGTASGFVESFTNPAIQFSNDPSTGRVSSLSGAGLQGFEVFKGGTRARTEITFGVTRRF
jgi:hypothetical protein